MIAQHRRIYVGAPLLILCAASGCGSGDSGGIASTGGSSGYSAPASGGFGSSQPGVAHTGGETSTQDPTGGGGSGVGGASGNPSVSAPAVLLDDFEDGDQTSLLPGSWYTFDDVADGGASVLTIARNDLGEMVMAGEGCESQRSLSIDFSLDEGTLTFNPYVGFGVILGEAATPFDLSPYSGITYRYRGSAHTLRVETFEVTDFDVFGTPIPESANWSVATVAFSEFQQAGWGTEVPLNLSNVGAISIQIQTATGTAGSLAIDTIGFTAAGG